MVCIIVGAVSQVLAPALFGEVVDCYLAPQPGVCWYANVTTDMPFDVRMSGIAGLIGLLVALFIGGSLLRAWRSMP